MALRKGSEGEMEEFHSLSGDEMDNAEDHKEPNTMEPPVHPVRSMQGAFEESILESTDDSDSPRASIDANAEARRQNLLESKQYDNSWTARWKQKKTARYHPLVKLMAQIVFGLHLLQQQQAKSEEEVVKILQTHVNEVDTFLERTSEDFDLAVSDIEERIRFLKLPMGHQDVFEIMLDDQKFRTQLLEGNDKIENIIDRTTKAMNASLSDIRKAAEANKDLGKYLNSVHDIWPKDKRGIADVFGAMRGNEQGWTRYLKDLQTKGYSLREDLTQLATLVAEMSKLAATASRRNKIQGKPVASGQSESTPSSPALRSKFSNNPVPAVPIPLSTPQRRMSNLNKALPKVPREFPAVPGADNTKPHPVPFAERYEFPRESPRSPNPRQSKTMAMPMTTTELVRPKTAGATLTGTRPMEVRRSGPKLVPREARAADAKGNTSELADFLRQNDPHQNPLRSNPPDVVYKTNIMTSPEKKLGRSQSQGASLVLNATPPLMEGKGAVMRSRSQGALDILKSADNTRSPLNSHQQGDRPSRPTISLRGQLHSTGFARRLSKRMKHIPVPEEDETADPEKEGAEKPEQPPDSAYSSGSDKKLKPFEAKVDEKNRLESTLGPLPVKVEDKTFPARVITDQGLQKEGGGGAMSVRSLASTSKSRTLSVKNFLPRRWQSRRIFAT